MHRIRVYVDSSVFGGVHDDRFRDASRRFFRRVANGEFVVLISRLTTDEIDEAPEAVRAVLASLSPEEIEPVTLNEEVRTLAEEYLQAGVLGESSRDDAVHVAAATVASADLILSWNFKHIVNFNRIRGFNGVNNSKTEVFDCVEMKGRAQRRLNAEYESRKHEFPSYFAFLEAKSSESEWQRAFWERVRAGRSKDQ
jgi:predicted nucleic acid-binding protein